MLLSCTRNKGAQQLHLDCWAWLAQHAACGAASKQVPSKGKDGDSHDVIMSMESLVGRALVLHRAAHCWAWLRDPVALKRGTRVQSSSDWACSCFAHPTCILQLLQLVNLQSGTTQQCCSSFLHRCHLLSTFGVASHLLADPSTVSASKPQVLGCKHSCTQRGCPSWNRTCACPRRSFPAIVRAANGSSWLHYSSAVPDAGTGLQQAQPTPGQTGRQTEALTLRECVSQT